MLGTIVTTTAVSFQWYDLFVTASSSLSERRKKITNEYNLLL